MNKKLLSYFETNSKTIENYLKQLLKELVEAKTVNASKEIITELPYMDIQGQEIRCGKVVMNYLEELGIKYDTHTLVENRPNIIAYLGDGPEELLIASHMDVVPAGDGWSTDPFNLVEKDGFFYGRGVVDDKGPLACSIAVFRVLKEIGFVPFGKKLLIGALSDEEYGTKDQEDAGLEFLLKNELISPKYALIPDVGQNMRKIDIAEKGIMRIKVIANGVQAHGAFPEKGVNAIYKMSRFLTLLETFRPSFVEHNLLGNPSINPGIIRGGEAVNIVPAICEVILDVRYLPSQSREGIIKELKTLSEDISDDFEFDVQMDVEPHEVSADCELVKVIQKSTNDVLGFTPEVFGIGGGTYAKWFNLGGITSVGFSIGDEDQFHIANEKIELEQLVDFTKVLCQIIIEMFS